eukprot:CAMPEP_0197679930 /NCGR_PEP_ID=MMETSP1338-20131121/92462_1 /TAXON_ID=43686 ORGANISM="Pelagodinium beii, Strain RCC1491" /NCGR_SAMPLE_ID=MMETSP1338 /ASSEMBLY_ACC=CAM_ASM_000754 /LENGTH=1063 /DNA_ID=CAMNT_0043261047 /DNA_START=84 /DNA_END=3272 /DNA_ORIENTATION=+
MRAASAARLVFINAWSCVERLQDCLGEAFEELGDLGPSIAVAAKESFRPGKKLFTSAESMGNANSSFFEVQGDEKRGVRKGEKHMKGGRTSHQKKKKKKNTKRKKRKNKNKKKKDKKEKRSRENPAEHAEREEAAPEATENAAEDNGVKTQTFNMAVRTVPRFFRKVASDAPEIALKAAQMRRSLAAAYTVLTGVSEALNSFENKKKLPIHGHLESLARILEKSLSMAKRAAGSYHLMLAMVTDGYGLCEAITNHLAVLTGGARTGEESSGQEDKPKEAVDDDSTGQDTDGPEDDSTGQEKGAHHRDLCFSNFSLGKLKGSSVDPARASIKISTEPPEYFQDQDHEGEEEEDTDSQEEVSSTSFDSELELQSTADQQWFFLEILDEKGQPQWASRFLLNTNASSKITATVRGVADQNHVGKIKLNMFSEKCKEDQEFASLLEMKDSSASAKNGQDAHGLFRLEMASAISAALSLVDVDGDGMASVSEHRSFQRSKLPARQKKKVAATAAIAGLLQLRSLLEGRVRHEWKRREKTEIPDYPGRAEDKEVEEEQDHEADPQETVDETGTDEALDPPQNDEDDEAVHDQLQDVSEDYSEEQDKAEDEQTEVEQSDEAEGKSKFAQLFEELAWKNLTGHMLSAGDAMYAVADIVKELVEEGKGAADAVAKVVKACSMDLEGSAESSLKATEDAAVTQAGLLKTSLEPDPDMDFKKDISREVKDLCDCAAEAQEACLPKEAPSFKPLLDPCEASGEEAKSRCEALRGAESLDPCTAYHKCLHGTKGTEDCSGERKDCHEDAQTLESFMQGEKAACLDCSECKKVCHKAEKQVPPLVGEGEGQASMAECIKECKKTCASLPREDEDNLLCPGTMQLLPKDRVSFKQPAAAAVMTVGKEDLFCASAGICAGEEPAKCKDHPCLVRCNADTWIDVFNDQPCSNAPSEEIAESLTRCSIAQCLATCTASLARAQEGCAPKPRKVLRPPVEQAPIPEADDLSSSKLLTHAERNEKTQTEGQIILKSLQHEPDEEAQHDDVTQMASTYEKSVDGAREEDTPNDATSSDADAGSA